MYKEGAKSNPASLAAAAAALFLLPLSGGASDLLRRTLLCLLQVFLSLVFLLLSLLPSPVQLHPIPIPTAKHKHSSSVDSTCASRALSHVLSVVSLVPVSSRKYDIVRSLADRLLDENLRFNAELNQRVLADAFSQTICRLEATLSSGELGFIGGAVKKGIKRWWPTVLVGAEVSSEEAFDASKADKLAAELLWIGEKLVVSGAVEETVVGWGAATGLSHRAVSADARLQVALVRVTVFFLRHANLMQSEEAKGAVEEQERSISAIHMSFLKSWLPLLCRATNGAETPTLNNREKVETVRILVEMIAKLSWEQQEEVLALWLHHFAASPDSDWPNLESYYAQWYSDSHKLFIN
ncbi:BTB/POZ domain protein [Rhynchospora pubera]|uniref:BTB/POZ domain protein n=1 Tax=Rhynchospora pubera TaxID=906938 RepID=A0AAV8FHR7_9POAL|nr:BTB/POZ domain protein [Rhynchospora pubera]